MTGPQSLRALLAAYRPAGERTRAGGEAGALAAAWPESVGADVARRTRAATYRDGTLTVLTPSSAWSHQLTFLAPTIIERLRERCPGVDLRRLKFIVATGRSRALLVGAAPARSHARTQAHGAGAAAARAGVDAGAAAGESLEELLQRLRREQASLDAQRAQAGWRRCATCGCWADAATRTPVCVVCADASRRAADGRIAGAIAGAPWLTFKELREHVPGVDARSYERVRRTLMTQWEQHVFNARQRLRRDALDASDRVVAWSYAMLATQRRKDDLSEAALAGVLGRAWADALGRKAARPVREKSTK
jgi:hypothetical protein